jgi:hypothetical protein
MLHTILLVGKNQIVPFPQQSTSAGASCAVKVLCLGDIGALDGSLEVLEGTVGDLAEDGSGRRL